MTPTAQSSMPLVAVVCDTPLVYGALEDAFAGIAGIAGVARLDADGDDLVGLIGSLAPDAVVVACDDGEARAEEVAAAGAPVLRLSLREPSVRLFVDGAWERPADQRASPEAIRNIVVGTIFGRTRRR